MPKLDLDRLHKGGDNTTEMLTTLLNESLVLDDGFSSVIVVPRGRSHHYITKGLEWVCEQMSVGIVFSDNGRSAVLENNCRVDIINEDRWDYYIRGRYNFRLYKDK